MWLLIRISIYHIYRIFVEKTHFLEWEFSNWSYGIQTWFKLCQMTWVNIPSTFIKSKNYLNYFWSIFVCEYIGRVHLFPQIYSNLQPYKMKRNSFFFNILPKLYSNIICKKNCDFFSKVWSGIHSNMHTPESNTMRFPQKASS